MRYQVNKEVVLPTKQGALYLNEGQFFNTANDPLSKCGKRMVPMLIDYGFIEETTLIWQPKNGEEFWFVCADGTIGSKEYDDRNEICRGQIEIGNYFEYKWQAEAEVAKHKAREVLLKDSKGYKPDPNDQEVVYQVVLVSGTADLTVAITGSDREILNGIYFYTYNAAADSMEKHRKEWLTLFNLYGEVKDEEVY